MSNALRGFGPEEFRSRTLKAQALMQAGGLSALLLTTEPEVRYYTGFLTRFWESPTRPWFVVLPASGDPIAVIPAIGAHLMGTTWISDIRTWAAPDYTDDGIGLLAETLREVASGAARVGLADQLESHARMPLGALARLKDALNQAEIVSDQSITRRLRMNKSPAEIAKIATAAQIAGRAFGRVAEVAQVGTPLDDVFRRFQVLCLDEGADYVPYLAGAAAPDGYRDVISPATEEPLRPGDVLMLDTGLVWDGYFCDFDRNYSLGAPTTAVQSTHTRLIDATQAGFEAAKPDALVSDLFRRMAAELGDDIVQGRLGHGLGMQLTEWPSILEEDQTVLDVGMVLTLEPAIAVGNGRMLVHEENIVITESGAEYLSPQQGRRIRTI